MSEYSQIAKTLAENVHRLRTAVGLTQAALAAKAGVTVETVARLERILRGRASANANPGLETMSWLAAALGVDTPSLLSPATPSRKKAPERLDQLVRDASPMMRRRLLPVVEALICEEVPGVRRPSRRPKRHSRQ